MEKIIQKQLTEGELAEYHNVLSGLVDRMPEPRREKVHQMLDALGANYFLAPASSQLDRHSCYPGGLMVHSLNVVSNLKKLADALRPGKWANHVLSFVGLFHDLGKAGDGTNPYYVPNPDEWQRTKWGKLYEINPACVWMPTSERGLYILQDHGVRVSPEEYLAIRLNDGQYVRENEPYRMKEPELALLVHWADRLATEEEKPGV